MKPFWKNRKVPMNYTGEYVIYSADLRNLYYERTKEQLSYDGIDYIVALTISKEMEKLLVKSSAADVQQRMVDHAQRESQKTVSDLINLVTKTRSDIKRLQKIPNPVQRFYATFPLSLELKESCGHAVKSLCSRLEKIPEYQWKAFTTSQKEYKKYQGKSAAKVIAGGAGLTVSVASLAASAPTAGGTMALSIIAIQRSMVDLYQNVKSLAISAETVLKKLEKDLITLQAANSGQNGMSLNKREMLSSAVKTVSGYSGAVASARGLRGHFELLKSKHQGLLSVSHRYTVLIVAQLNNVDNLAAYLRSKAYDAKQHRRVSTLIDVTGDKLHMYLEKSIEYSRRWTNIGLALNRLQPEIGQLNKSNTRVAEVAGRCLEALSNVGLSLAGGVGSIADPSSMLSLGKDVGSLVADLAKEAVMTGLDLKESLDSKTEVTRSYA